MYIVARLVELQPTTLKVGGSNEAATSRDFFPPLCDSHKCECYKEILLTVEIKHTCKYMYMRTCSFLIAHLHPTSIHTPSILPLLNHHVKLPDNPVCQDCPVYLNWLSSHVLAFPCRLFWTSCGLPEPAQNLWRDPNSILRWCLPGTEVQCTESQAFWFTMCI